MKMRPFAIAVVAALLLVSQPIAAQDQTALDFEAYTLGNGLKVILVEDHTAPVVAILRSQPRNSAPPSSPRRPARTIAIPPW